MEQGGERVGVTKVTWGEARLSNFRPSAVIAARGGVGWLGCVSPDSSIQESAENIMTYPYLRYQSYM